MAPDLQAELIATRRELAAVRLALLGRRVAQSRPVTSCDTVRALSAVLNFVIPEALRELSAERDRLVRDLGHSEQRRRRLQHKYSMMRYNIWHIAQRGLAGFVPWEEALDEIRVEASDSEDDRDWEEGDWVQ